MADAAALPNSPSISCTSDPNEERGILLPIAGGKTEPKRKRRKFPPRGRRLDELTEDCAMLDQSTAWFDRLVQQGDAALEVFTTINNN
jgi:hypothetical protein